MAIALNPEQERIINEEIKNGHFHTADGVVDSALGALRGLVETAAATESQAEISPEEIDRVLDELATVAENVQPLSATFSREDIYSDFRLIKKGIQGMRILDDHQGAVGRNNSRSD